MLKKFKRILKHKISLRSLLSMSSKDIQVRITKPLSPDLINVKDLLEQLSIEELNETAENYFASIEDSTYHLKKPFTNPSETAEILTNFSQLILGMNLLPGMSLIDFGSGSCWSTRFFSQLGLETTALDVSPSALEIGKKLFEKLPIIGKYKRPTFLNYDGKVFPIQDDSIDRIACIDAFHHVPNQEEVLSEFFRVLKPNGLVGFVEPGPTHSTSPQSQYEMKTFKVIENDIFIEDIWQESKKIGFSDIEIAIYNPLSFKVGLNDFNRFIRGFGPKKQYLHQTQSQMSLRRTFFLHKGMPIVKDSRVPEGLKARIRIKLNEQTIGTKGMIRGEAAIKNIGSSLWRSSDDAYGPVNLGVHLFKEDGSLVNNDFVRISLPKLGMEGIQPGAEIKFDISLVAPECSGSYLLEFDLVSEMVTWFGIMGSKTQKIGISVN